MTPRLNSIAIFILAIASLITSVTLLRLNNKIANLASNVAALQNSLGNVR